MTGRREDAAAFAKKWAGKGDEKQHTQLYWIDFFTNVLGCEDALERLRFEVPSSTEASAHKGYADVLIPTARAIVEQKSLGIDLSKPEQRQGRMVTPAQQANAYAQGMPLSQQPRYVIACNFEEMWVYDRERDGLCREPTLKLPLNELPKNLPAVQFLKGRGEAPETVSQAVSIEAGRIMGRLYEIARASFIDPDSPESHHALSVLMTRLMFLMFCEDAGIIGTNAFRDYVRHFPAEDLRGALKNLFVWLDTPPESRDPYAGDRLKALPYMNGGLFRERTEIPPLDETFRTMLLVEGCQEFDWSGVSPTVFGSIFEGALSHDHRHKNGQHFTSPENIRRVIGPLFLDELEDEFAAAKSKPTAGGARTKALRELHRRLGEISILDPAAGSGNFLTESYLCLRRLENKVIFELKSEPEQASISFEGVDMGDEEVMVSLRNFHGIEIEDFACCVAKTALWIAEKQADSETASVTTRVYNPLPLTDYESITQGNALRMDWNEVVPADRVTHICGNPPFIGNSNLTGPQKEDRSSVFGKDGGVLDYVACWHKKTADFMRGNTIRAAFVSTNSICQGQQVEPLWRPLFDDGIRIDFAYRPFVWNSEATDEAHVHVVIVGFSRQNVKPRLLFDGNERREVENINAYLSPASNVFITKRRLPLSPVPQVIKGFQPTDNGNLVLSDEERGELLRVEPGAEKWIRPFITAKEFINGKSRWCLWLAGITPSELKQLPQIRKRVEKCREWRNAQTVTGDAYKLRDEPHLMRPSNKFSEDEFVVMPRHSSQRRKYIPFGFESAGNIPGDSISLLPRASVYHFGVLSSRMHNVWTAAVCGRIKSDYRYTSDIVYNNFVWPEPTESQREEIEKCARAVLEARRLYRGSSLADMYDPDNDFLFPELLRAHRKLDAAVEAAYGVDFNGDEEKMVSHLFTLYAERTAPSA